MCVRPFRRLVIWICLIVRSVKLEYHFESCPNDIEGNTSQIVPFLEILGASVARLFVCSPQFLKIPSVVLLVKQCCLQVSLLAVLEFMGELIRPMCPDGNFNEAKRFQQESAQSLIK